MADSTPSEEDRGSEDGRLSARELAQVAKRTVAELTGYPTESVSGLQWDGENWLVSVEVRELERVPNTTDVMASYVVQLDESGQLIGYKRDRRYTRGQAED